MITLNVIKEQYQKMTNEQLIQFAENEGLSLTTESFHALKEEFENRDIDISIIKALQEKKEDVENQKQSKLYNNQIEEFELMILNYAIDQKFKGASKRDIFQGLLKKGATPEFAYLVVVNLKDSLEHNINESSTQIILSWLFTLAGFLLVLLNYKSDRVLIIFGGISFLIMGVIALYKSYVKKTKFKTALNNLKDEEEQENENNIVSDNLYQ